MVELHKQTDSHQAYRTAPKMCTHPLCMKVLDIDLHFNLNHSQGLISLSSHFTFSKLTQQVLILPRTWGEKSQKGKRTSQREQRCSWFAK